MGFRFRKTIKIFPGVHLNISKTGVSLSIGGAPITFNFGRGRSRVTGSLPGTGMSYQQDLNSRSRTGRPSLFERLWRAIRG